MTQPNGAILWEGPSPLDGQPLVLIVTGLAQSSANDKTGDMLQTWILRADVDPWTAFQGDEGFSNCGNCTHRLLRTCYVRWYQAPLSIWHAYKRGSYTRMLDLGLIRDRMLRIGSAGDPALVPPWVWEPLLAVAAGHTGYTHLWRESFAEPYRQLCQASCDGFQDYLDATAAGWKPFLVLPEGVPDPAGAVHCPSSKESGRVTDCATCALCDGASAPVVINAHGASRSRVALLN